MADSFGGFMCDFSARDRVWGLPRRVLGRAGSRGRGTEGFREKGTGLESPGWHNRSIWASCFGFLGRENTRVQKLNIPSRGSLRILLGWFSRALLGRNSKHFHCRRLLPSFPRRPIDEKPVETRDSFFLREAETVWPWNVCPEVQSWGSLSAYFRLLGQGWTICCCFLALVGGYYRALLSVF